MGTRGGVPQLQAAVATAAAHVVPSLLLLTLPLPLPLLLLLPEIVAGECSWGLKQPLLLPLLPLGCVRVRVGGRVCDGKRQGGGVCSREERRQAIPEAGACSHGHGRCIHGHPFIWVIEPARGQCGAS